MNALSVHPMVFLRGITGYHPTLAYISTRRGLSVSPGFMRKLMRSCSGLIITNTHFRTLLRKWKAVRKARWKAVLTDRWRIYGRL